MSCLAVIRFFLIEQRRAFNPLLHVVISLVAAVAVGFVPYNNVNPAPLYPIDIALPLAGGWLVVGSLTAVYRTRTGRTGWLDKATRVLAEKTPRTAAENSPLSPYG